jgi:hypothetical protein
VLRTHDILVLTDLEPDLTPDPAIFVSDLEDGLLLFEATFTSKL